MVRRTRGGLWTFTVGFTLDALTPSEQTKVLIGGTVAMGLTTVPPTTGLFMTLVPGRVLATVGPGLAPPRG